MSCQNGYHLHFKEHTLGGEGVKMKIIQLFFALIEDFGCSFKLNFDGRGGQNGEKSQNSIKNCIKS
jgi:hypothetical protein